MEKLVGKVNSLQPSNKKILSERLNSRHLKYGYSIYFVLDTFKIKTMEFTPIEFIAQMINSWSKKNIYNVSNH